MVKRAALAAGRSPRSSSVRIRVFAELVFDQGFDLFVILALAISSRRRRSAAELAASPGTDSLSSWDTRRRGDHRDARGDHRHATSQSRIRSIRLRAPVSGDTAVRSPQPDSVTLIREAVRANVRVSVDHLTHGSALSSLSQRWAEGGRRDTLETVVTFFDTSNDDDIALPPLLMRTDERSTLPHHPRGTAWWEPQMAEDVTAWEPRWRTADCGSRVHEGPDARQR
jgi:hypothetical protein